MPDLTDTVKKAAGLSGASDRTVAVQKQSSEKASRRIGPTFLSEDVSGLFFCVREKRNEKCKNYVEYAFIIIELIEPVQNEKAGRGESVEDTKLLSLLRSDSDAGMNQLIKQFSGLVFSIAAGILSGSCDSSEIEDCVTDVFLRFQSGLCTFVPVSSLKNYLSVIARNTAVSYLRKSHRTEPITDDSFLVEITEEADLTDKVIEKLLLESIYREIAGMGYPDSDIVIRKLYFGQTSKQIAKDLGMTVSNVDTRSHRAVEKLRVKFGDYYNEKEHK